MLDVAMVYWAWDLKTWMEVSREPYRHQHSVSQFASARTRDGRMLRFNWACYSLDPETKPNEFLWTSSDNGQTWSAAPTICPVLFACYPHRLRTLRDGTLVVCVPNGPRWGKDQDHSTRTATRLDTNNEMRMSLFFRLSSGPKLGRSAPHPGRTKRFRDPLCGTARRQSTVLQLFIAIGLDVLFH